MSDLIAAITGITNPSDFPCCDTAPIRALVWRIVSRDPDENEDHYGDLISYNHDEICILKTGDTIGTFYPRPLYRLHIIPAN